MNNNKKILLIVGFVVVMGLSAFAYQNYFSMPEFKNETITKGLQISVPIDSNFLSKGNSTFQDNETNMSIKILKSENSVVDANINNPKETINHGSNIIMVFENYTVVTNKNKEIGIKISDISNVRGNIVMKIAESVLLSLALKSKKISEEEAIKIATETKNDKYKINSLSSVTTYTNVEVISSELLKYKNKTVYKINISYREGGAMGSGESIYILNGVIKKDTVYIDAYSGKIL